MLSRLGLVAVAWVAVMSLNTCTDAPLESASAGDRAAEASAPSERLSQEDMEQHLVGTWLREHADKKLNSRRLLRLQADGSFEELVRLTQVDGQVTEHRHAGTWLFDGTNLKRKYTLMNDQPPSRLNLPFATFQIQLPSRNELVGVDHIRKHRVHYRRVQPETEL